MKLFKIRINCFVSLTTYIGRRKFHSVQWLFPILSLSSAEAKLSIKLLFVFWPLLIRILGAGQRHFWSSPDRTQLVLLSLVEENFGILFLVISTLMVSIIGLLALSILPRVDVSTISTYFLSLFYNIRTTSSTSQESFLFSKTSNWGIIVCIQSLFAKLIFIKYNGQWL